MDEDLKNNQMSRLALQAALNLFDTKPMAIDNVSYEPEIVMVHGLNGSTHSLMFGFAVMSHYLNGDQNPPIPSIMCSFEGYTYKNVYKLEDSENDTYSLVAMQELKIWKLYSKKTEGEFTILL